MPSIYSLDDTWVAIYVLTVIGTVGWGIILGLAVRVGGIRNLFRVTSSMAKMDNQQKANRTK